MKKSSIILTAFLLVFMMSCKKDKKETDASSDTKVETTTDNSDKSSTDASNNNEDVKIVVKLEPRSDAQVSGNVIFRQENGVVTMIAVMGGLSEGMHAIHLHEKSDCSSPDGKSSGGHWNPTAAPHGKWGASEGYHKGDVGNFTADANGNGTVTFVTDEWCIGCGDANKDILGKAVIVHQGVDDFTSQPSGAAGSRVSCGAVIE